MVEPAKSGPTAIRCGRVATELGNIHYREADGDAVLLLHINRHSETYPELPGAARPLPLPSIPGTAFPPRGLIIIPPRPPLPPPSGQPPRQARPPLFPGHYPKSAFPRAHKHAADGRHPQGVLGRRPKQSQNPDSPFPPPPHPPPPDRRVRRAHRQCGPDCWQGADALMEFDLRSALAAVRCPVLLLPANPAPSPISATIWRNAFRRRPPNFRRALRHRLGKGIRNRGPHARLPARAGRQHSPQP